MPTVSGRVTTPDGQPVAGGYVHAWDRDQPRRRVDTHTDASGAWLLELPSGTWVVRDGQHSRTVTVPAAADLPTEPSADTVASGGDIDTTRASADTPSTATLAASLQRHRETRRAARGEQ